jgi:glycosyltransferase involved in cell wall biosynthesis
MMPTPLSPDSPSNLRQEMGMEGPAPLVSVVIPTLNRPQLVVRAVRSAVGQTLRSIEVIVIIDGPDAATVQALRAVNDSRVRVMVLPRNRGPSEARNEGVKAARGRWIAFLDHDDEWLPGKLEIQLRTARKSASRDPIVSCRFIGRRETHDVVLPRRLPTPFEPISEYLFRRTGLPGGEGLAQSSTILTTKELLRRVPFRAEARRHDDIEWILRAAAGGDTALEFVTTPEPLAIWHREERLETISGRKDWQFSFSWIQQNRHLVTSRAYASFLLTWVSANAIEQRDRSAFWPLLKEAFRNGTPSILDGMVFAAIWLVPQSLRRQVARYLSAERGGRRPRPPLAQWRRRRRAGPA